MKRSVFKFYKNYCWTHFGYTSYEAHVKYQEELAKYDPVKKQETFEAMLKEFEEKLTKAKQKGKVEKVKALEQKVGILISGRLQEYNDFDRQGFGRLGGFASCTHSVRYNEKGEAIISVEFKDENVVPLTSAELKEILGERALNKKVEDKIEAFEKDQEVQPSLKNGMEVIIPASKELEKTKKDCNSGLYGICSYDIDTACGCDEYEKE